MIALATTVDVCQAASQLGTSKIMDKILLAMRPSNLISLATPMKLVEQN